MDISIATLEDLKKLRPDLYLAVKQEVCAGESKTDIDESKPSLDESKPSLDEPKTETEKNAVLDESEPKPISMKGRRGPSTAFDFTNYNMVTREATVGDLIQRKSDGRVGEVLDIRNLTPSVKRIILKHLSGRISGMINEVRNYYVIEKKAE